MWTRCVLLAVVLTGCAAPIAREVSRPVELTPELSAKVQDGVRHAMKDPESARFGTMRAASNSKGDVSVCGYVNGRNSLGGYTGDQPFVGMIALGAFHVTSIGATFAEQMAVKEVCRNHGISLDP